jgi:hypothetical protein
MKWKDRQVEVAGANDCLGPEAEVARATLDQLIAAAQERFHRPAVNH